MAGNHLKLLEACLLRTPLAATRIGRAAGPLTRNVGRSAKPQAAYGGRNATKPIKLDARTCAIALLTLSTLGGCTKFELLNATVPTWGYNRSTDLAYGPHPRQKLDVYRPHGAGPAAPVVVFFHGGDWQEGSKTDYRFVAQALTTRGFIAVLPNYRLYPTVRFPAFVDDGALAVRWTAQHIAQYGGDPQHIFLMGHSAGAHIAALLTLDAHYLRNVGLDRNVIRATAALSGPYDFIPAPEDLAVFGMTSVHQTPDPAMEPIHFVDGKAPPMLLVHGLLDQTVGPDNAAKLADRIRAYGGEVKYISYPDRAHVGIVLSFASMFRGLAPTLADVSAYFHEHAARPLTSSPSRD